MKTKQCRSAFLWQFIFLVGKQHLNGQTFARYLLIYWYSKYINIYFFLNTCGFLCNPVTISLNLRIFRSEILKLQLPFFFRLQNLKVTSRNCFVWPRQQDTWYIVRKQWIFTLLHCGKIVKRNLEKDLWSARRLLRERQNKIGCWFGGYTRIVLKLIQARNICTAICRL
jgi:hypothetical protein